MCVCVCVAGGGWGSNKHFNQSQYVDLISIWIQTIPIKGKKWQTVEHLNTDLMMLIVLF